MGNRHGVPMNARQVTAARRKRDAKRREREEKRWASRSGPVTVRFECPICGGPHARADH